MKSWMFVLGLALAAPAWAQGDDGVGPSFDKIDATSIVSANIRLPEISDPADLVPTPDGKAFTARGVLPPKRAEKSCPLAAAQITAMIGALKHAKPDERDPDGVGADMVVFFMTRDGGKIVAIIGDPKTEFDGASPIYFSGRFALLAKRDRDVVRAAAAAAGCAP